MNKPGPKLSQSHPRTRVGHEKVDELVKVLDKFDEIGESKRQKWNPDSPENKEKIDKMVEHIRVECNQLQKEVFELKSELIFSAI